MEDKSIADYFVIAGLPENPEPVSNTYCEGLNPNESDVEPITDITVIFPSLGEMVPKGFNCIERTPSGFPANLNSGSIRSPEVYLCFKRGRDKPPLVDIGVIYEGKEMLLPDAEVVASTPEGRSANVNNTGAKTLLTFRRAGRNMPCNELVVTDICVIMQNKGERPPHAFCIIMKNLNRGMMGCDVYLCYKKSMNRPPLLAYKAEVLLRYPQLDRKGFPFPTSVAMFCLPMCATVESWPADAVQPRPVFSTFVLTVADATEKIYGAGITFYESYPEEKLNEEQKKVLGLVTPEHGMGVHVNKCICLLSHFPFFDSFKTFLYYLHAMCRTGPHDVPIERYISYLLEEVPFPSPSRPNIMMQLSATQHLLLSHVHDSPLPKSGASFRSMVNVLGSDNCLMVLLLMLTEQKVLVHSLRQDMLTTVVEAIAVIMFPFHWQCPYIPLCPLALCDVLQAPVPFLVGVDSRFFDMYELPSDITCVDLDTNNITLSEEKRHYLNIKLLAKKPARILKHTLEEIEEKMRNLSRAQARNKAEIHDNMELEFKMKKRERMLELEIQEAFLRFMTSVLKGYRSFLLPITKAPNERATDASRLFDFNGFLRSRDKNYQKFYQLMMKTQMFSRFIEERSFVSDMATDTGLAFFDECVDKVTLDETELVRLIDYNEGNQSDRTVVVLPPEAVGLPPSATYFYDSNFVLNKNLFPAEEEKRSSLEKFLQREGFATPGSPVARRTKQEIKSAKKNARKFSENPMQWARYLMSTCYTLWFIHLPSYVSVSSSKPMALCLAYEMLVRMAKNRIQPVDEVCYRVVMQLCGMYNQPVIAVKVLFEMKKAGLTPNAITYGFYNKAVLEAEWPSNVSNSSQLMWMKLRNVIYGVAQFRSAGRQRNLRNRGIIGDDADQVSTGSGVSGESQNQRKESTTLSTVLSPHQQTPVMPDDAMTNIPTRISSVSDIGYASMSEQRANDTENDGDVDDDIPSDAGNRSKAWPKWTRMGQSLDQWVKSGVNSMATLASLASDTSYYSPSSLIMGDYKGSYMGDDEMGNEETDNYDINRKQLTSRRLDFDETNDQQNTTQRLLRSVSFGNDTQIMSKLKELRKEMTNSGAGKPPAGPARPKDALANTRKVGSVDSNGSLETKVNEFYEQNSREGSVQQRTASNSREVTPLEEETIGQENSLHPESLPMPRSPSIAIKHRTHLGDEESSPSSPARTPVTQNDPLGALNEDLVPIAASVSNSQPVANSPKRANSEGFISHFVVPTQPGVGGHNGGRDLTGTGIASKQFHRSSTLPNTSLSQMAENMQNLANSDSTGNLSGSSAGGGSSSNVVSGLSVITSLKNPFGRYSPARLSLRKAGTSFIESTLGKKKAEALMEGINQAAASAKVKLDEFKEAMVTNNYPAGRNGPFGYDEYAEYGPNGEYDPEGAADQWASVSEAYLDQLLTTEASTRASFASVDGGGPVHGCTPFGSTQSLLQMDMKFSGSQKKRHPVAIEFSMTTCSLCHTCESLLFDEEIMAGWTSEDSNLNSRCPHCRNWALPFLEITVRDFRHYPLQLQKPRSGHLASAPSIDSVNSASNTLSRRGSALTRNNPMGSRQTLNPNSERQTSGTSLLNTSDIASVSNCVNGESPCVDPLGALASNLEQTNLQPPESVAATKPEENETNPEEPTKPAESLPELHPEISNGATAEPIIVPYLSPLVLRKELENVLEHEGDSCLTVGRFVDEHPIIYWNMIWFFCRANLTSHIKSLALSAESCKPKTTHPKYDLDTGKICEDQSEPFSVHPSWGGADARNVSIMCKWDNPKYHEKFGMPLYMQHLRNSYEQEQGVVTEETETNMKLISDVLRSVQRHHLTQTCPLLLFHYHKEGRKRHYPCYRDILFLTLTAGGREFCDSYGFNYDREYRDVYSRLRNTEEYESMEVGDTPPSDAAICCRKYFRDLIIP